MAFTLFVLAFLAVCATIVVQCFPQSVLTLLPDSKEDATLPKGFLWAIILILLAFNAYAYDAESVAIGVGLFGAFSCLGLFAALPAAKRTFFAWAALGIGILATLAFGFRANEFVQAVNVITALLAVGALFLLHAVERIEWNALWLLRTIFFYPSVFLHRVPGAFRMLKKSKVSGFGMALRVIGITVVLLVFFTIVLSSADPIFAQKISILREQIVPRTLWSLVLAVFLLVVLVASFSSRYTYKPLPLKFISWLEAAVPVGAVCVLFGVFLWVQGTYLFADHESFQALDLTYAEYVRKGMIELLIATFCAGLLSYVLSLKEREQAGTYEANVLRGVNAVLLIELFLMLASAWRRDVLYMDVYGLTRVRLIGEIFLAWLAVLVVLFAVFGMWRRLQEKAVFVGVIAASFAVVVYLNAFNMDAKIVAAEPPAGQQQDVYYMSLLSIDAVEGWWEMLGTMEAEFETMRTKTTLSPEERMRLASIVRSVQEIAEKRRQLESSSIDQSWTSWRWSDAYALSAMRGSTKFAYFSESLDCLLNETGDYRWLHDVDLSSEISSLQYDYRRPFVTEASTYDYGAVVADGRVTSCL